MCDVGCESRSCLDTSLDNCSSERDNDSTVFSRLVLCVLSAFFSVSGTYHWSILKIKTMTKIFITQVPGKEKENWKEKLAFIRHFIIEANITAVSRSPELWALSRSSSYSVAGSLDICTGHNAPLLWCPDHGENVGAESVYISTCPELPPLQAPALSTADYCCRLQLLLPTVACFMRAESIIVSFHRSSTLNKLF